MDTESAPAVIAARHEVIRSLGRGSFGRTFLARHVGPGQEVALKLFRLAGVCRLEGGRAVRARSSRASLIAAPGRSHHLRYLPRRMGWLSGSLPGHGIHRWYVARPNDRSEAIARASRGPELVSRTARDPGLPAYANVIAGKWMPGDMIEILDLRNDGYDSAIISTS